MSYLPRPVKTSLRCLRKNPRQQEGIVIVLALFIVALVAAMAYGMMERLARDTRQTTLILHNTQAEMYAQGSVAWAIDQLRNDWIRQKNNQIIDAIPIKSAVNEKQGYKISSTIYDMQARFNLNNLVAPDRRDDFKRLLRAVKPDLSEEQANEISQSVLYWLTPQTSEGMRNKYYLELSVPYRAASRLMQSASELRLVKGITPELYNALKPYITALPTTTPINVQTAEIPVLMSLSQNITLTTAKTIEALRTKNPFLKPENFSSSDVIKNHNIQNLEGKIITVSNYFLVETEVKTDDQRMVLFTLLERTMNGNNPVVTILWQAKGAW